MAQSARTPAGQPRRRKRYSVVNMAGSATRLEQSFFAGGVHEALEPRGLGRTRALAHRSDPIEPGTASARHEVRWGVRLGHQPLIGHLPQRAVQHARPEMHAAIGAIEHLFGDGQAVQFAIGEGQQDLEPVSRKRGFGRHGGTIYLYVYTWPGRPGCWPASPAAGPRTGYWPATRAAG